MQLILAALDIKDVQLVDNHAFFDYMKTQPNTITLPEGRPVQGRPFDPQVKAAFERAHGATEFETVSALQSALTSMFWHRAHELETAAILDVLPPPDLSSCSAETQEAGWDLYSLNTRFVGLDLENYGPFY